MKICFINPTVLLRRPIVDLAQIFTSQGHEVAILTPGKVDDIMARESDVKAEKIPAVSMIRVPSYEIASVLWSFPLNVTFIKTIQKILDTYDIVHIWAPYYILSLAPLLFRKKKAKIVLTFDTFPGFSFRLGGFFMNTAMKVYTVMASRIFNRADKITIYGNQLLPYAKKIGLDQSRIQKLPTGIFLEKKDQRMYNSRKDRHVILFVGLLNDRKGVNTIISVAKKLENTSCNFVLVGDGPSRKKYEAMVAEQNLQQVIRFVGSSTKVRSYYENADIFFLPSKGEGLPGVIMEAMSYGLPIVSSNIPCIPDIVGHGSNGMLCDSLDITCFTNSIRTLTSDSLLAREFGRKSEEKIQKFSWDVISPLYTLLYKGLLK